MVAGEAWGPGDPIRVGARSRASQRRACHGFKSVPMDPQTEPEKDYLCRRQEGPITEPEKVCGSIGLKAH